MSVSEKAMAPHSSTLAWKIPWMEEPGRLKSMGLLRVGHDWATSFSLSCIGEGNGNPLQCSCLENPRDRGAWWAAIYGVAQSRKRLKWLSSSNRLWMLLLHSLLHNLIPLPGHLIHHITLCVCVCVCECTSLWILRVLRAGILFGLFIVFIFFPLWTFYIVLGYSWLIMLW